ncbi:MAG: GT4 family glycosyltransferase PelF [Halanaerobiales bacterium]|nr:GT4 family glycosyltransferase PelF [Halanaerobiales bacterium]
MICIIAEGSYPYITGGVSSWIHQLISELPDMNFKVLSLMPSNKEKLECHYDIPDNLKEIRTVYLDDYLTLKHRYFKKRVYLNRKERECLSKFISMDSSVNWKETIKLITNKKKLGSVIDFLQSEVYWNILKKFYQEKYSDVSFNTFFWTIRTMLLPFLHLFHYEVVEADIYHAVSTGYAGILSVYFHEMNQKPLILTEHGIYAREREEEIIKAKWVNGIYKRLWIDFFYFLSTAAYKEADTIIALFERNRNIQLELGVPRDRTRVISNGVDLKRYTVEKEVHVGYNIGAILRIVPIKDVMTLIRAFKIIKETVDSVKLYLIGPTDEDPEYFQQCKGLVKILQLEENIIFTGRADVKEYFKKIDVLVLTSISEAQPLVILEGMASGIPVVSTDVGSCKELLEKDENEDVCGIVTNLVSPNETAAQILRLLKNPDLRNIMGQNGRKRVERAYSKELFIENYRKIYERIR